MLVVSFICFLVSYSAELSLVKTFPPELWHRSPSLRRGAWGMVRWTCTAANCCPCAWAARWSTAKVGHWLGLGLAGPAHAGLSNM